MKTIEGNLVDVVNREIYPSTIKISERKIVSIERNSNSYDRYIMPGFVDAHVHVESSMLLPVEFSNIVTRLGTVAIVNDPHEIANVLGMEGVKKMMENSEKAALKFYYGIPSCVPATPFDRTAGKIDAEDAEEMAATGKFVALSEMMNIPGVLNNEPEVMAKLAVAKKYNLRIDGHAPALRGDKLSLYIGHGIETDHECVTLDEAEEKIMKGMKVIIREGSAAKNYEALKSLIGTRTDDVMFCTDDAHPDDLLQFGHINYMVKKALSDGFGIFDVLQVACLNPVRFYRLDVGTLNVGDKADFIITDDIERMNIISTFIDGENVFEKRSFYGLKEEWNSCNLFHHDRLTIADIETTLSNQVECIKVMPDELVTGKMIFSLDNMNDKFESDLSADVLKIVYLNRYLNGKPQVGFVSGFGIKRGAFASCISHDSHNIIAIGCTDEDLVASINAVIEQKGGLSIKNGDKLLLLPLPIGGIISNLSCEEVAGQYLKLNDEIKTMGSVLKSPFMTLSFMSLIVIPYFKIGEKGMFDYNKFDFV